MKMSLKRPLDVLRIGLTALLLASFGPTFTSAALAEQVFVIGTGGTAGTYFPIGGIVAKAVSQPGKIVATAQVSNGSLANINAIVAGSMESGFSQADVATWAYSGTGIWEGRPRARQLRLIANLYPESVHIVLRKSSGIKTLADLKGKRVGLDELGSGTLINAKTILAAYGLKEAEIKPEYIKADQAAHQLKNGSLDAFFFTGGTPAAVIAELASGGHGIELLAIDGRQAEGLREASPFYSADFIAAQTYKGIGAIKTLAVGAQWLTTAQADTETIYQMTKALFSAAAQKSLSAGHAKGAFINLENAVKNAGIPFHPGAEKFYREVGALK